MQLAGSPGERGQRRRPEDRHANVGETARAAAQAPQREGQAMAQRQPVGRQFVLLHQLFERDNDRIVRRQIEDGIAELARTLPGEVWLGRIDLHRLQEQHVGVEPHARARRHQPHAEEVAEL